MLLTNEYQILQENATFDPVIDSSNEYESPQRNLFSDPSLSDITK